MNKKTMFILGGSLIGILVVLLVAVWIMTNLRPNYYDFDVVEEKIAKATEKYYLKNPQMLPTSDGKYNLDYSVLSNSGVIKPLNEIIKGGENCSANIIVTKEDTNYTYIPYVNCGELYTTKELYKQILNDHSVVSSGSGLYKTANNEYYFRGKIDNNYVAFGSTTKRKETINTLWRIISIENDVVKLRSVNPTETKTAWDNRYNENEKSYIGYNDFDMSLFKDFLTSLNDKEQLLNDKELAKIEKTNLCIGKRGEEDETIDGSAECAKLSLDTYYFGTITPYEYIRASIDENCKTLADRSCSNYNFIAGLSQEEEWTTTASLTDDYQAYIFKGSSFYLEKAKSKRVIYPVIKLNKYAFFKSGTGTLEDPYLVK